MGFPHLRDAASCTTDAIQTQCILLKSLEDALESSMGHDPELSILGDVCCYIPMSGHLVIVYRVMIDSRRF